MLKINRTYRRNLFNSIILLGIVIAVIVDSLAMIPYGWLFIGGFVLFVKGYFPFINQYIPKLITDPADAMDTYELLYQTLGIANAAIISCYTAFFILFFLMICVCVFRFGIEQSA
jgi:hypothetical protein